VQIAARRRTKRCTSRSAKLKMPNVAPSIINVRFAGERCCSADCGPKRTDPIGTGRRYNPSYG
jgi:hypothetical protein